MSDKMVKCGSCQGEMAKSAKTCPKCGAPNKKKGGCLRWGVGGLLLFIGIMWAVSDGKKGAESAGGDVTVKSAGQAASQPAEATAAKSAPTPTAKPTIKIGDTISTPQLEITVSSARKKTSVGNEMFSSEPAEGGVFVAVQWEYKNISKAPIGMWSQPSLHIKDPNGAQYDADVGASGSYATELNLTEKNVSDLNPGIKVKSAAVFEVSTEILATPGWKMFIDADKDVEFPFSVE